MNGSQQILTRVYTGYHGEEYSEKYLFANRISLNTEGINEITNLFLSIQSCRIISSYTSHQQSRRA